MGSESNIISINEDQINNINNELLLKYDDRFNKQYNKFLSINSSIMNKERIIYSINEEINNKNTQIDILKYLVFYTLLICTSFILYALKKINLTIFIIIIIILSLIYLIIVYFIIRNKTFINIFDKELHKLNHNMKYNDSLSEYSCPSKCSPIRPNINKKALIISGYSQPTLNTDSQVNVWKYGDIPVDSYTSDLVPPSDFYTDKSIPKYRVTSEEMNENQPQPFFGSPSLKVSTYYDCSWNGGDLSSNSLPNIETNKYSKIPCNYRENYSQNGKYLCTKDPNKLSSNNFNTYCKSVN
jgi:hypothetical protein